MANKGGSATNAAAPPPRRCNNLLEGAQARLSAILQASKEDATRLLPTQPCADEISRLHDLACKAATRAEVIEGTMTPKFADANQLRMLWEAKEEALGYLSRVVKLIKLRSVPQDSSEPIREA